MATNLFELIFNQFVDMVVECAAKKKACKVDNCDFNWRVHDRTGTRVMEIVYLYSDECKRQHNITTIIDITNICTEDLVSCSWIDYITKIARDYVCSICPTRLTIVKEDLPKCREEYPKWQPFVTRTTTTITRQHCVEPVYSEPEVIIDPGCPCVETCEREPCPSRDRVIIKYKEDKNNCCGCTQLKTPSRQKYGSWKDNTDYNNHQWGSRSTVKTMGGGSSKSSGGCGCSGGSSEVF